MTTTLQRDQSLTFSILGVKTRKPITVTFAGKIRTASSLSRLEVAFLASTAVGFLSVVILTIIHLSVRKPETSEISLGLVFLINILVCVYYLIHGVLCERPYELVVLVVATVVDLTFLIVHTVLGNGNPLIVTQLALTTVFGVVLIVMGILLIHKYQTSRQLIFRTVGANSGLQDMCHTLFIFIGVLKADLQLSVTLAVLELCHDREIQLTDKILLPVALIVVIVTNICGYVSARWENRKTWGIYAAIWILFPIYTIFLIIKAAGTLLNKPLPTGNDVDPYALVILSCALSLGIRGVALFYGIKVYNNFGKGLKEKVYGQTTPSPYEGVSGEAPKFHFQMRRRSSTFR